MPSESWEKKENLTGYYWGLYELPEGVKREDYHCYYFSPEAGLKKKVYFSNSLFESIFSAPHGMTTGYEKVHGRWRPIFAQTDEERRGFLEEMEKILLEYGKKQATSMRSMGRFSCKQKQTGSRESPGTFYGKAEIPGGTDIWKSALFPMISLIQGTRLRREE